MSSLQTGSATGNPRNKTALKPGHSLMDWIRLGNSGTDLTGVKGQRLLVSKEQLAQHNKDNDVWMCIRGVVYNVTRYMDFHPGGREELMKGAGQDATELFNKVHPWVNYESILQKCIVGKLGTCLPDENPFVIPKKNMSPQSKPKPVPSLPVPVKPVTSARPITSGSSCSESISIKSFYCVDWFQQLNFVCFVFYLKSSSCSKFNVTLNETREELTVSINNKSLVLHLEHPVEWPCQVKASLNVGKFQLQLDKQESKLWKTHSTNFNIVHLPPESIQNPIETTQDHSVQQSPQVPYHTMRLIQSERVNHNVVYLTFQYTGCIFHYVPLGYHVHVRLKVEDVILSKPYTPVDPLLNTPFTYSNTISFIIKHYETGSLSPALAGLTVGQEVEVSSPEGSFDVTRLAKRKNLVMIAAGTGLTPMIPLVNWAIQTQRFSVQLLFYNRSEEDIIWKEKLDKFAADNLKFSVEHILSDPTSSWQSLRGRISLDLLHKYIPTRSSDLPSDTFVCVCGPIGFNQTTQKYLSELNYRQEEDYFCFGG